MYQQENISGNVAPNNYENYTYPSELGISLSDNANYSSVPQALLDYLNTHIFFTYLPGWALQAKLQFSRNPHNWENIISAGVDCIHFVGMSS